MSPQTVRAENLATNNKSIKTVSTSQQTKPQPNKLEPTQCLGVVLAGGQSKRMGKGEKFLKPLNTTSGPTNLLSITSMRLNQQLPDIIVNTNTNKALIEEHLRTPSADMPIISDMRPDFAGPLAGLEAAMHWAETHAPEKTHLISVAADSPYFPENYVTSLIEAQSKTSSPRSAPKTSPPAPIDTQIILAQSDSHIHPVFGLWPITLHEDLTKALDQGIRKIRAWAERHPLKTHQFPQTKINGKDTDPFFNINTPEEWQSFIRKEQQRQRLKA